MGTAIEYDSAPVANNGEIEAVTGPCPPDVNGEESRFLRVRVTMQ
jgi:hypothetical protein